MLDILMRHGIQKEKAEKMQAYADAVLETNRMFNLTRITSPKDMAEAHFLDALVPVDAGYITSGEEVLDIGTGAGFPGVPIAIYEETIHMTLLDASVKKTEFVKNATAALEIPVRVVCARAEEVARLPEYFQRYDVVLARAVAKLNVLLEIGGAFVKKGGFFLAYKGPDADREVRETKTAAAVLGFSFAGYLYSPLVGKNLAVAIYKKDTDTPPGYPRRFSKIKKRPL